MNKAYHPWLRWTLASWGVAIILFIYLPIVAMALASFTKARYFRFPIKKYSTKWYEETIEATITTDLHITSIQVAAVVAGVAIVLGFMGAMAFARFDWRGRSLFQRILLIPIFFPQAVLGLALLQWFTFVGVTPSWEAAVFGHLVWIIPIVTLVISIQIYGFDVSQEEAAADLGANRWQVLREVTLPVLGPGIFSGGLFAFLLSWGNFPLSAFVTGADSTVPEWLFSKMSVAYTPMITTIGTMSVAASMVILFVGYFLLRRLTREKA